MHYDEIKKSSLVLFFLLMPTSLFLFKAHYENYYMSLAIASYFTSAVASLAEKDENLPPFIELCLIYGSISSVMSPGKL